MAWDEVCILCGIRPNGGPTSFCTPDTNVAAEIAKEIHNAGFADMPTSEVTAMILDIFHTDLDALDRSYTPAIRPSYETDCIAIGHFDTNGDYEACQHHGRALHPTGDDAVVRRVAGPEKCGCFAAVVALEHGARVERAQPSVCATYPAGADACANVWVHATCWAHLRHWLAPALPARTGRNGRPLSGAGELYEVAASRRERQQPYRGALPCVDYGGALDAYMGGNYQDYVVGPRNGVKHIARALNGGLRGAELVPAILEDSRAWMWTRPDMWPREPQQGLPPLLNVSASITAQPHAAVCRLPGELWPGLLQPCPLEDLFALAATCRALCARVLDRGTLAQTLRRAMADRSSSLRWTLPVPALGEEWRLAWEAMQTWLPAPAAIDAADSPPTDPTLPLPLLPFFDPAFPIAAFLRAYSQSDSMRARRRRWELIKQWDALVTNYRRYGWERDEFAVPGTTWALDSDDVLVCQCLPVDYS